MLRSESGVLFHNLTVAGIKLFLKFSVLAFGTWTTCSVLEKLSRRLFTIFNLYWIGSKKPI
jgi:hypothetical protein